MILCSGLVRGNAGVRPSVLTCLFLRTLWHIVRTICWYLAGHGSSSTDRYPKCIAILLPCHDIRGPQRGNHWPNFTMPDFEYHAEDFLNHARTEFLAVSNLVKRDEREEYEAYARNHYKDWVKEGHYIKHGNLDKLSQSAYHPFITRAGSEPGTFDPEDEFDDYLPSWTYSPPPVTYGATNINQRGDLFDALKYLKNETLVGPVSPFTLGDIIFSIAEHEAFHSSIVGSSGSFPHGRYYHPVNRYIGNFTEVVAMLETVVGFDVSMRNLLPVSVNGMMVVLENTCNQTYTYRVDGPDAFFLGDGDHHDHSYDSYERQVDFSFLSNARALETPGHCVYTLVRSTVCNPTLVKSYINYNSNPHNLPITAHLPQR